MSVLQSFVDGYGLGNIDDSHTSHVSQNFFSGYAGSLDEYLLDNWYSGARSYDAVYVQNFSSTSQVIYACSCLLVCAGVNVSVHVCMQACLCLSAPEIVLMSVSVCMHAASVCVSACLSACW